MNELSVNRRRFLQGSGGLLLGTLLFSSGPIALLAPSHTWALETHSLSSDQAAKLLTVVRRIYPHDNMEDAVYALVVKALDERAASDPSIRPMIEQGLAALDTQAGGVWAKQDESRQVAALQAIAQTPFFNLVRSVSVTALYSNELAYAHFGYEGASFPKGGYLMRGFNDLDWLQAAPAEASPPAFS